MQIIIDELVNAATGEQETLLPWIELRHQKSGERIESLNEFSGRHILRSHLPADKVFSSTGKYIFIGRDPRDLVFNLFQFLNEASENWYNHFNQYGEPLNRPSQNFQFFWEHWIFTDGKPFWPYFEHLQSWWRKRNEANVLLIHFLDFKANMEKELRRISEFLDLEVRPECWPKLLEVCEYQRISEACRLELTIDSPFWNGGEAFNDTPVSRGTWKPFLTGSHGTELVNRVTDLIGKAGQDWLLSVR